MGCYFSKNDLLTIIYKICLVVICLLCSACATSLQQKRSKVVQIAVQQVGVPYKYGGYEPKTGFDCSGLVYYVYRDLGYNIPRTVRSQYQRSQKVYFFKKPGDLLFFNLNKKWWKPTSYFRVDHVGIYLSNDQMIHAPKTGSRVTIVSGVFNNKYWKKHYYGTRRIIH